MKPIRVAVISESKRLKVPELRRVVLALQKQLDRDFTPIWNVCARLEVFASLEDMPVGRIWVLLVKDKLSDAASYHDITSDGVPFGLVELRKQWSHLMSHTLMEMLVDPLGKKLVEAPSIVSGETEQMCYLVEVCDPCTSTRFGYDIDGILVSDFSTPAFWKHAKQQAGKFSFTGALRKPFQVQKDGFICFMNPKTRRWRKVHWFGERKAILNLDVGTESRDVAPGVGPSTILFRLSLLREHYRAQEPIRESIRRAVEELILEFRAR